MNDTLTLKIKLTIILNGGALMTTEAIVANHISKSINHKEIINDLSITIPKHSMTHIQGHNGSGKTNHITITCTAYQS